MASNPFSDVKLRFSDTKFPGATSLVYNESQKESSQWVPSPDQTEESPGKLKKIPEVGPAAMGTDFISLEKVWVMGFSLWEFRGIFVPSLNGCSPTRGQHLEACEKCRLSSPTQDLGSKICTRTRFPGDPWARWRLATLSVASERGLTEPPVGVSPEDTCFYFIFPIQKAFKVWLASVEGPHFCLLCGFHAPPDCSHKKTRGLSCYSSPESCSPRVFIAANGWVHHGAVTKCPRVGCLQLLLGQ